jgi:hypothetical protein
MKTCTIVLIAFCLISGLNSARADLVTAINVTADYYPGNQYSVGFDLDPNHLIDRVYFQDENGNKTFWTLDELSNFQTVFMIAGFKVVQMRIASHVGNTQAVIELQYTANALAGTHASLMFQCSLDAASGQYNVTDKRSGAIIHSAEATTRYNFMHVPVGVSGITTQ